MKKIKEKKESFVEEDECFMVKMKEIRRKRQGQRGEEKRK